MIYGPYKRQSRIIKPVKTVWHNKRPYHYYYRARPDKQVARLRTALAFCLIALIAVSVRLIYLYLTEKYAPVFADWRVIGTLTAASAWLLFLLRSIGKR